jgi:hypothetical protein
MITTRRKYNDFEWNRFTTMPSSRFTENKNAFIGNVKKEKEETTQPDVWPMLLDLYVFILVHMADVPDELHEGFQFCGAVIPDMFISRNPYQVQLMMVHQGLTAQFGKTIVRNFSDQNCTINMNYHVLYEEFEGVIIIRIPKNR